MARGAGRPVAALVLSVAVRKADVDDILLFDELSDGEQVYLERMALFHLLEGESDALLLLDEPEVHFNDKWKREIVDIVDSVLRDRANDVLIATHSSITLTDVFNDEIILFDKTDGQSVPPRNPLDDIRRRPQRSDDPSLRRTGQHGRARPGMARLSARSRLDG